MVITGREATVLAVLATDTIHPEWVKPGDTDRLLSYLGSEALEVANGILGKPTTERGKTIAERYLRRARKE